MAAVFKSVSRAYHQHLVHIVLYLSVVAGPLFKRIVITYPVRVREMMLLCLSRKLGHGLDDDIRRAGNRLRDVLVRDFERDCFGVGICWTK